MFYVEINKIKYKKKEVEQSDGKNHRGIKGNK